MAEAREVAVAQATEVAVLRVRVVPIVPVVASGSVNSKEIDILFLHDFTGCKNKATVKKCWAEVRSIVDMSGA